MATLDSANSSNHTDDNSLDRPDCNCCCRSRRCKYCSKRVSNDRRSSEELSAESAGFTTASGASEPGRDAGGVGICDMIRTNAPKRRGLVAVAVLWIPEPWSAELGPGNSVIRLRTQNFPPCTPSPSLFFATPFTCCVALRQISKPDICCVVSHRLVSLSRAGTAWSPNRHLHSRRVIPAVALDTVKYIRSW